MFRCSGRKAGALALFVMIAGLSASSGSFAREGSASSGGGIGIRVDGRVKLLDLAEAKRIRVADLPEFGLLKQTLDSLRDYNQTLSDSILRAIEKEELHFYMTPFDIKPTDDSQALVRADEVQVAAQRGQVVMINEGRWQAADAAYRVGTLIHEIILNRHIGSDRLMLRRVVDRIVARDFGDEESFTRFLYSMGFRYPAGWTPGCRGHFDSIESLSQQSLKGFRASVSAHSRDVGACVETAARFNRELSKDLYLALPPDYCASGAILMHHDGPLADANLKMTQECLAMAVEK